MLPYVKVKFYSVYANPEMREKYAMTGTGK